MRFVKFEEEGKFLLAQVESDKLQESYLRVAYVNSGSELSYKKWKKRILRKMEKDNRK